ncbi:DMT family transporter [Cohnella sp.]|uniref:DMT family transporter n=1 Tax=Cohnella sp. TaxID=1883426 RepID=UPI0035670A91
MSWRIVLLIILVTVIWGYTWSVIKIGLVDIPPFFYAALRLIIGALPLFALQLLFRKRWIPARKEWGKIAVMSLFMSVGYFGLLTYGMQFVSSGKASILVFFMPIVVCVLARFVLRESLTVMKTIGLSSGVTGLLFIIGPQLLHPAMDSELLGQLLIVGSAVCWACATVMSKKYFTGHDIIVMTSWQMLLGGVILLGIAGLTEPIDSVRWTLPGVSSLLFTGVFSSAIAFVAWFHIVNRIEASLASIALMMVPVLGLLFGWLQLGESVAWSSIIGALFICTGILFASLNRPEVNDLRSG